MRIVLVDDDDDDDRPFEDMSVAELRRMVRAGRVTKSGVVCHGCERLAKDWGRTIHKTKAKALLDYYRWDRRHPGEYMHVKESASHEASELKFWGVLEEERKVRDDGGRAGYWRITDLGRRYVEGEITLPKYAVIYKHTVLRMDGPDLTFAQCLQVPFDLQELWDAP